MAAVDQVGSVMVVGGGISGMQSALDLADSGFKVYLLDRYPTIGGVMAQLDKTFPTNDCAMCIMAPKLVATGRHHNIEIVGNADVINVEGEAGHFYVTVNKKPLKINEESCTGCGVCATKCPAEAIDEFNEGLRRRPAISIRYPQAIPLVFNIDTEKCIGCGICAEECKAGSVEYDQDERMILLEVGSIILSPGFEKFVPDNLGEYGYGTYRNVVSSIEFERILSATGPYAGTVLRPSDGDVPENVAFIQCVGSRDQQHGSNPYCSAVCCMYAMKEAVIAQEHTEGLKSHIFYMDIRAHGKEFDDYRERAESEYGIEFTRSRVANITEDPKTRNLTVHYVEDGEVKEKEFKLVVLGVGFKPPEDAQKISEVFGIDLNKYDFCATNTYTPLETTKSGVYVSGAFSSPKDIPDTVAQASGAAAMASGIISGKRWTETVEKDYPPERDVTGEEPKIGVFVCRCGINIAGVVDVPGVVEYAKTLPGVVHAEENLYTCSQDTQERMAEKIRELGLNRTIVASCTPRTHEPLFRNTTAEGGLNPYLFEMANIRDQCSWVHMHEPEKATKKAKDLVRMAVAKSRMLEPLDKKYLSIIQKGLVLGGGLAGMTAALGLAEQGFETYLIEKESELGGNLRHIHYTLSPVDNGSNFDTSKDPQAFLKEMVEKVHSNDKIKLYLGSNVKTIDGFLGNFETTVETDGKEEILEHGAVVIATGAHEYKPKEYLYGESDRVMTQVELEDKIVGDGFLTKSVVMIQCVGSRDDEYKWCSRVCCNTAIKNALKLKELDPETKIYMLYKDIRTYGFKEDFYRKAAEQGVLFINYDDENKPVVTAENGGLKIIVKDPTSDEDIELTPDHLVLSTGTHPNEENESIGKMLKVPLNKYKFFLEAHMKLRPVDFATEGVFLAGMSHGPKLMDESISQAYGAVARATTILAKDQMVIDPTISFVIDEYCDGCAYCVDPCPYNAITLIEYQKEGAIKKTVEVNETACKGCGVCQATCPKKGIVVKGFKLEQLTAMVDAALEVN